jgi:tetratricopeptide (TPR) repeat protein
MGHLVEVARLDPGHFYARYYLARALALVGRPEEAIARYREALGIDGSLADARYELAALLAEAGENEEAAAHLRQVLALKPDHNDARALLEDLESR